MKDKQTYKTRKEHGNDMSYENEATITNEDRGELDLTFLIEQHKKEIWEFRQKESQWVRDKNLLDGNKRIIEELSTRLVEMGKANLALKKRVQEAEGETSIVKGIGNTSPEMKALQAKIKELESSRSLSTMDEVAYHELRAKIQELKGTLGSAQDINDNHQRYNGKLQTRLTEVEEDNKKLSEQIQDLTTSRKFGDGTH